MTQSTFTVPKDAHEATWLAESLERPWGRQPDANYVASIIPRGFAAYARILHPAYKAGAHREMTWAEVAHNFGQQAHAQMQWHAITRQPDPTGELPGLTPPAVGSLPEKQANALLEILGRHTPSAGDTLFAIWEGWGAFDPRGQGQGIPHFELPNRGYYLLQAPLAAAAKSMTPVHWQSANLWWPQDRAWCVATEIDLMCTYVGGSTACIAEIVADIRLEAWQATVDDRVDIHGDQINMRAE